MNIPLIDTPAAIQIIPRLVIEEQGARRLSDVMRNVSGVQNGSTRGGRVDIFVMRGFQMGRIARDGFPPAISFNDGQRLGLANVERVEVLKGPASVLYGAAEPGGLINVVTKRPEAESRYSFTGKAGSFDFYNADIDLNQPLTKDGKLLARLNASYESADSFRDLFIKSERTHLAPSLRWRPTARTTADFDLEYYKVERPYDPGLIAIGGKALALPRERFLGSRMDRFKSDEVRLQTTVDHQLNENWSLRALGAILGYQLGADVFIFA